MVCAGIETLTDTSIIGLMQYPTSCDYYYYSKIMAGIFIILTFILWYREKESISDPDWLSCMGVSAIATIVIASIGTLIGIIQVDILIEIVVAGIIIIAIWIFKK